MVQMGVTRMVLEAAYKRSLHCWTSPSMGFSNLSRNDFLRLEKQYTLVVSDNVAGRCIKLIPSPAALAEQVSLMDVSCALCCAHSFQYSSPALQQLESLPPTTTPTTFFQMYSAHLRLYAKTVHQTNQ